MAALGTEFRLLPDRIRRQPGQGTASGGAAGAGPLRKASANIAGIMNPIPMPRPAPASPCVWAAVSRAIAAFIFRSLFRSSKTPSRLLSSIAFCTSGGGVIELM